MMKVRRMPIDQATISRLHHTALRASHTTLSTFEELQSSIGADGAGLFVLRSGADLGVDFQLDLEHARSLTSIVTEISSIATLICKDLALLCELALANGSLTSEVHRVLSHVLLPTVPKSMPVDIRTARLIRLPAQQAIDSVASELDEMCDRIDILLVVLKHQHRDHMTPTKDDGSHHE